MGNGKYTWESLFVLCRLPSPLSYSRFKQPCSLSDPGIKWGWYSITQLEFWMMPMSLRYFGESSHVHTCQQCIVRGLGFGLGFGLENKERSKKIKGTAKPLMVNLDITGREKFQFQYRNLPFKFTYVHWNRYFENVIVSNFWLWPCIYLTFDLPECIRGMVRVWMWGRRQQRGCQSSCRWRDAECTTCPPTTSPGCS